MSFSSVVDFILLAAIWGSSFLFMRIAIGEFGVMATAAVRVLIASAVLLPLVVWRRQAPELRRNWKPIFWIGLINSGIPFALFAFSLLSITTGMSAILNATAPLFGALVAWLWLGDRLTGSRVVGLAIGFAGVAMLAWDKAGFRADAADIAPAWAVFACLAATLLYGIAANAAKRYLTGLSPLVTAAGSQIGATIGLAIPALFLLPRQMPGTHAWLAVIVAGVLCTAAAYILYFRLIEQVGPARAVAVTFVVPVFAVIYGTLFLGEQITPWMLLCGLVIVCGTALSTGLVRMPSLRPQA